MPTLYRDTGYSLTHLIEEIRHGNLALPDIQRPFVWSHSKVRELFDSMYRGFPVGTLLFWETEADVTTRQIDTDSEQRDAKLLIVDGQQRLTSLFAVITGAEIVTKNFDKSRISIAFRPKDETFEVADAAIKRDPEFISNITVLWEDGYRSVIRHFLAQLNKRRTDELTNKDTDQLEDRIDRVRNLREFRFQVLVLRSSANEEQVAEIFVRVNSQGVQLKQSDFILTLMSVHWEKGRRELEQFCREAIDPSVTGPSPKNSFLDPAPEQLLRVGVGLAFRRGRLEHVYNILRGKDLKTKEFNDKRLDEQFGSLKNALNEVLHLTNWHEFMKCLTAAGFRGRRMITAENAIIYTYLMWLIGRRDFGLRSTELRGVISRWFFMAHTTGRYTNSPESQIESDLGRISDIGSTDGEAFCETLDKIIQMKFTNDYWGISLPNLLDKSSPRSPALSAYWAALNLLDANLLFSNMRIRDLFDLAVTAPQSIGRHHLFPREHLSDLGVTGTRQVNAIANMAFVDWPTNVKIVRDGPADYWPEMSKRLSSSELEQQMYWHALFNGWEQMEYGDFLKRRRSRIAKVVRKGFQQLWDEGVSVESELSTINLIALGESQDLEFKSTGRWNLRTGSKDSKMEHSIVKTVCGFMNAEGGGILLIGVKDDGQTIGLRQDYRTLGKSNKDGYELWLRQHLDNSLSCQTAGIVRIAFDEVDGKEICVVHVGAYSRPVFAKSLSGGGTPSEFWVRVGNATKQMHGDDMEDYKSRRWD